MIQSINRDHPEPTDDEVTAELERSIEARKAVLADPGFRRFIRGDERHQIRCLERALEAWLVMLPHRPQR